MGIACKVLRCGCYHPTPKAAVVVELDNVSLFGSKLMTPRKWYIEVGVGLTRTKEAREVL
jgi:hypothetical protein